MSYARFIAGKLAAPSASGLRAPFAENVLFPHQRDLVRWALQRGRAAIFADTGLGKTRMELAWADAVHRATGRDVLILAPLAVGAQTVREAAAIGLPAAQARDDADVRPGVTVTNYDRLHRFDTSRFGAVVLDESSVIKHHDAKTFGILTDAFAQTPFKLCATATPAPNDWTELGTHAEFLGVCTRAEMLAEFFTHDGGETSVWRLKGHAKHEFWRWVCAWGALIRRPSDLGYDDAAYALPDLMAHQHVVEHESAPSDGQLFASEAQSLSERREARRDSLAARVKACARMVNAECGEPWVVWCDLNAEGDALRAAIPDAVEIRGADAADTKEQRLIDFAEGRIRVLVSKPSICGWGLNWQHAARMAFVGVTDSFESYYQSVRRCWRFGQTRPVAVHLFTSPAEGAVLSNLNRKAREAALMAESLSAETRAAVREAIAGTRRQTNPYQPSRPVEVPAFLRSAA